MTETHTLPLPHYFSGTVVKGFGRGGKQLGCPTANVDDDSVKKLPDDFRHGVYYGLARISGGSVHNMVMSIGTNPTFDNNHKTAEVHLLSSFTEDFYGSVIDVLVLGFVREMRKFDSLDELIQAIQSDIAVSTKKLNEINRYETIAKYFS